MAEAWAPGRVNLIGEHTDYNGGLVMPMALALGVRVTFSAYAQVCVRSTQYDEVIERAPGEAARGHWSDYVVGALNQAGVGGADVLVESDLPLGAGLSSSAALIVAVLRAAGMKDRTAAALAAQRVENDYIGVPCGIMDQMAVAHLSAGQLMILDTATLAFETRTPPPGWRFAVHHSGVERALTEGRYAERRDDCEAAARGLGVRFLCELSAPPEPGVLPARVFRRERHIITDNVRVSAARAAMAAGDAPAFARLMDESHASMRDDFEITTPEVDAVAEAARAAGALGARMTGGGFGGCIVSLVAESQFNDWRARFAKMAPHARFIA